MTLFHTFLHITNFRSPLLRTIVPSVAAAVALQAAAGIPSIIGQTERFYDISGSLTFLAVGALSLYLPALRARATAAAGVKVSSLPNLLAPFRTEARAGAGVDAAGLNWRQVLLTGAVALWAIRLGSYLFQRVVADGKDSRFEKIRVSPPRFSVAFFAQAVWVSLSLMPIMALNAVPVAAFAAVPRIAASDVVGLAIFLGGFTCEVVADRQKNQWLHEKRNKLHDEDFLTRGLFGCSRFPNYFGEMTLWTGLASTAAGILALKPIQLALGLSGGPAGILTTTAMCFVSPAFSSFLLLKVSGVPLSEAKYDKRYGNRKDYQEWKQNTPKLIPKFW